MSLPWDGDDSGSDDGDVETESSFHSVAAALLIRLRRDRSTSWKRIRFAAELTSASSTDEWISALQARGLQVVESTYADICDVVVWDGTAMPTGEEAATTVVPGGYFLSPASSSFPVPKDTAIHWNGPVEICPDWMLWERALCSVALDTCPWLQSTSPPRNIQEPQRVAVVPLSASERERGRIDDSTRSAVVDQVRDHGYCVVPGLLCAESCTSYGSAILEDMHAAADIIRSRGGNLYQPSATATGTYREISLREDWRLDLRDGPALRKVRREHPEFLRQHPDLMAICEDLMFPSDPKLAAGNYGKYNFSGTLQQRLSTGAVGGIVSLPAAADQAIHADTPHLFEVGDHLPPHYVNFFAGAIPPAPGVGPTALIHGSHRREYVAQHHVDEVLQPGMWNDLVRPRLEVGDVLVMDCRILHFGVANTHATIQRPLLYTNVTAHWFHDPKNWDDQEPIFEDPF